MNVIKDKLKEYCEWVKIFIFIGGLVGTVAIYISSIITIPNQVNNHEQRISKIEKDVNDIKIETISKLSSLQYDVRLIKEVLLKRQ